MKPAATDGALDSPRQDEAGRGEVGILVEQQVGLDIPVFR
jgi:hypothetical protein